jgi:carnitine O-acetyltransferase
VPEWSTRTFGNEERLPRVPLPTLEATCARFLEWCAPLLDDAQLAATEAEVRAFLEPDGDGRRLHETLEKYEATEGVHSWLDTFWPYRYLGRRDRIALNANFFFLFGDAPLGRVERATALIAGALAVKRQVDAEELPPRVVRGVATSMEQFKYLFSTTRIPGVVQDAVRAPYTADHPGPSAARHVLVWHRGNAFALDVIGPDGTPHAPAEIAAGLQAVLDLDSVRDDASAGHLTTKARAAWAADRRALLALDPANAAALDVVETALFCVCLEDDVPRDDLDVCDRLLHGDSANRWFDKAVSFVVFGDGRAGINVEHCELDGTTILGFVEAVLGATTDEHAARAGAAARGVPQPRRVGFVLDDALRDAVREAAESFAAYAAATATTVLRFDGVGSDRAKGLGVSPDAFAQLAYQLAHRRAKGLTGATYESIATRQYRHGRTEAMRVVTPEILRFVTAMDDATADAATRRAAFRAAAEAHVLRSKECQAGQAPEQHLWELQLIQRRRGEEIGVLEEPALFRTPGWTVMREDYLSTSSAPSTSIQYFGFGSTSDRCIGVAYVLLPDRLSIYLSTPRAVEAGMTAFAQRLAEALHELVTLLEGDRGQ